MTNIFENKLTRYAVIACGILVAVTVACVIARKVLDNNNTTHAYDIARRLGYTDQSLLVSHESCWDLGSSCGVFIYYTSDKSLTEFTTEVDALGFSSIISSQIGGSVIFTNINSFTEKILTVDGINPFGTLTPARMPKAREWTIREQSGRKIHISHFDIVNSEGVYKLDNNKIEKNIVMVIFETK
jgi:hypothetical protein